MWSEWTATVPVSWINMQNGTFKWPPKSENATVKSRKASQPQKTWEQISYKKLLGPYRKSFIILVYKNIVKLYVIDFIYINY